MPYARNNLMRVARTVGLLLAVSAGAMVPVGCVTYDPAGASRGYPQGMTQSRVVNIQVSRQETHITLTNTTAQSFDGGTLWMNAQYARPIEGLAIGQTLRLDLHDFRNEHSEPFRAGGFFATERPDVLYLAQLETREEMIGLIVIGE